MEPLEISVKITTKLGFVPRILIANFSQNKSYIWTNEFMAQHVLSKYVQMKVIILMLQLIIHMSKWKWKLYILYYIDFKVCS